MLVEVLKDMGDGTPIGVKLDRATFPNADLLEKYRYIAPAEKPIGWRVKRPLPGPEGNYQVGVVLAMGEVFEPERLERLGYIEATFALSEPDSDERCARTVQGGRRCKRKAIQGSAYCGLPKHRE